MSSSPTARRCGARGQGGNRDDPDRLRDGRRPGQARPRREPWRGQAATSTGFNFFVDELAAKRMELLHELMPKAVRIGVLVNPSNGPIAEATSRHASGGASIGLQIKVAQRQHQPRDRGGLRNSGRERGRRALRRPRRFFDDRRDATCRAGGAATRFPRLFASREYRRSRRADELRDRSCRQVIVRSASTPVSILKGAKARATCRWCSRPNSSLRHQS